MVWNVFGESRTTADSPISSTEKYYNLSDDALIGTVFIKQQEKGAPWQLNAMCAQTNPSVFFPEKGSSTNVAKKICFLCPVEKQCLNYAINSGVEAGVWGGTSPTERRRIIEMRESNSELSKKTGT
jgi:WhiB family redox-sensing transcriptional regulator